MKINDLRNKTKDELSQALVDLRSKVLKLNFDKAEKKVKDSSQYGKLRKDIAKVLTLLNQK